MVLDSQPQSDVVVTIVSGDTGAATVGSNILTFTNTNWDTAQAVAILPVSDDDVAAITTSTGVLTVDENSGTGVVDVKLSAQSQSDVVIEVLVRDTVLGTVTA